jgi:hypothetical protein
LVLQTCKSHWRCLTHYFSLSPLTSIEVEEVAYINTENGFKKKFEFSRMTTQFIQYATRWQAHIFMTGEIHTKFKGLPMSEVVQKVCVVKSYQPTCAEG